MSTTAGVSLLSLLAGIALILQGCIKDPENPDTGYFTDNRDQHQYQWVAIGDQVWMAENLAWLPAVNPSTEGSETNPHYYVFRYEGKDVQAARAWDYFKEYGVFYNWPAVLNGADSSSLVPSGVRGICPEGWHVPSDGEWEILVNFLGGEQISGKSMKSKHGWSTYEKVTGNGTNSSGFNGLPAGSRQSNGRFYNLGFTALYWSATSYSDHSAWYRNLGYYHNGVFRYFGNKASGYAVRCVKD